MQVPSCTAFITWVRATSRKIGDRKGANETKVYVVEFDQANQPRFSLSFAFSSDYACTLFVLVIFFSARKNHFTYDTQKDTHKCVDTGACMNILLVAFTFTPSRLFRAGKILSISACDATLAEIPFSACAGRI